MGKKSYRTARVRNLPGLPNGARVPIIGSDPTPDLQVKLAITKEVVGLLFNKAITFVHFTADEARSLAIGLNQAADKLDELQGKTPNEESDNREPVQGD